MPDTPARYLTMAPRRVVFTGRTQTSYVYLLTEPMGESLHQDFSPQLTPRDVLELRRART